MEDRHNKKLGLACAFLILLAAWPPKQSNGQSEAKNLEGENDSLTEIIQECDSLNHALKVEIDLSEYQKNQADTFIHPKK